MKHDPDIKAYKKQLSDSYSQINYGFGLIGYFLKKSHLWADKPVKKGNHFHRILELGAGSKPHLYYLKHSFDEYHLTDFNKDMLDKIIIDESKLGSSKVVICVQDATNLSYPDQHFDRLIASHLLEHLADYPNVLREWYRVLKPGGLMTIVLPCDPGLAWRLGRNLFAKKAHKNGATAYGYWMAREHINPINNIVSTLRYYFEDINESWRPFLLPSIDINLIYIANIYKK